MLLLSLGGQPSVPTGDSNSSLGVDMSPNNSRNNSRASSPSNTSRRPPSLLTSFASSPLKPTTTTTAPGREGDTRQKEVDTSMQNEEQRKEQEEREVEEADISIPSFLDPFLQKVTEDTETRMERTTKSWIEKQQLMIASRGCLTIQEERDIQQTNEEKKSFVLIQKKRKKVALAAVKMAMLCQKEREQKENEDIALNSMINSLPEMFRHRVMAQVLKNRQHATHVATTMSGTFSSKRKSQELKENKLKQQQLKEPVPVLTEIFHEGGFNNHVERYKSSRIQKKKRLLQASSTKGTWAPGHTIVKPFSFDTVSLTCEFKKKICVPKALF